MVPCEKAMEKEGSCGRLGQGGKGEKIGGFEGTITKSGVAIGEEKVEGRVIRPFGGKKKERREEAGRSGNSKKSSP